MHILQPVMQQVIQSVQRRDDEVATEQNLESPSMQLPELEWSVHRDWYRHCRSIWFVRVITSVVKVSSTGHGQQL
jgi:hypothetical protein